MTVKRMRLFIISLILVFLIGCQPTKNDQPTPKNESNAGQHVQNVPDEKVQKQPVAVGDASDKVTGLFYGEPWTFVSGRTYVGYRGATVVKLYQEPLNGCETPKNPWDKVIEVRVNPEAPDRFVYLGTPGKTDMVEDGVTFEEVGDETISGVIDVKTKQHTLRGKFSVPVCPE